MVAPGLKQRYIDVYLPTERAKQEWEREAKKAGIPLSKYVYEAVEAFRASEDETPRTDLIKVLAEAKEEVQVLRNDLRMKTLLLEKLESDVYKARYADFKEIKMVEGSRRHDLELVPVPVEFASNLI